MTETIDLQKSHDGIAVITINRPEALNALTLMMMRSFGALVEQLASDDQLRAVIIAGAGDAAFCSGGDLYELHGHPTEEDAQFFSGLMGDALQALESLPVPVIAAINGYALGGGSEIAVACDMRVVDEKVRMGFVQIRLALTPGWGAGQRLLKLVGYSKTLDVLLSGRVMKATELAGLGLVDKIVARGTALQQALAYVRENITAHPPEVVRAVKALARAATELPYSDALQVERGLFPALWAGSPHLEAVDAFLRKQKAKKGDT